ncbi:hypothetical protein OROGR_005857 [Orobanche gracilis]
MALFLDFFDRKPPEGLRKSSERAFVFSCCLEGNKYQVYSIKHIVDQLRGYFPETSFIVHNFRDKNHELQIINTLFEYGITVITLPRQYENRRLLLPPEIISHFLSSSGDWLSIGQRNVLLMHCENVGALAVLAFMLAALLLYCQQYIDQRKIMDMMYKQVSPEFLQALSCVMNPLPSRLRYPEYVPRRNVLWWAPPIRALILDCDGGCRTIVRTSRPYADLRIIMLFFMPKKRKGVRYFKRVDSRLGKMEINCHVQGDVVLECITLYDDSLEDEETRSLVTFNTAFISSNAPALNLEETDTLWNVNGQFPKDLRAEVLFCEMDSSSDSPVGLELPGSIGKEGLPIESYAALESDNALITTQQTTASSTMGLESVKDENDVERRTNNGSCRESFEDGFLESMTPESSKRCIDSDRTTKSIESSEVRISVRRHTQSKIVQRLARYRGGATSALGITALLHDHAEFSSISNRHGHSLLKPMGHTNSSTPPIQPALPRILSNPPPPPPPPPLVKTTKPHSLSSVLPSPPTLRGSLLASVFHPPPPPPPSFSNAPIVKKQLETTHVPLTPLPNFSSSTICQDTSFVRGKKLTVPITPSRSTPPQRVCSETVSTSACSALPPARSHQVVPPPPAPLSHDGTSSRASTLLVAKEKMKLRPGPRTQAQSKKVSLKPYYWLKLTRAMQGSLWDEAQKLEEAKVLDLDMSELESLFSVAVPNSDHGGADGKSKRRESGIKPDKVNLIELRRAYNCEIMLTKVKVPLSNLMDSVLALNDSALDIDQVDNLIKFCPTKEEIELLKNYKCDKENLGKCEQCVIVLFIHVLRIRISTCRRVPFFLELMKVPRVESKLRVFSFKIRFWSQVEDLRKSLNIVNSASQEVRSSVKLKRIMQTILSLGNTLNHGTARGSAVGFRLDSLLKLSETRSRNNKLTLIHYLCKVLAEKLPEVMDFHEDLVSLEAATKIQLKYLAEEMQAISKGLEKVIEELTASEYDGAVSEHFCKTLKEFYGSAEEEVRSLASIYLGVGRNADALALYFGEDPTRCPFEQVVSTLLSFVGMFRRAREENRKHMELEKNKAQKEKLKFGELNRIL